MNELQTGISSKSKKIITALLCIVSAGFFTVLFIFVGKPLVRFASDPEKFRSWVGSHGLIGEAAYVGMMIFQVIVAIVPGEPFEIAGGYAFGAIKGTLLCLAGTTIGSLLVFFIIKTVGIKALEVFFSIKKIHSLKFLKNVKRLNAIVFLIYFIPGTPKDLIAYFVGLTPIKFPVWLFISAFARIPSVITSTIGGNAIGERKYINAVILFAVTAVISLAGYLAYRIICRCIDNKFSDH